MLINIEKLIDKKILINQVKQYAEQNWTNYSNKSNRSEEQIKFNIAIGELAEQVIKLYLLKNNIKFYEDEHVNIAIDKSDSFDILLDNGITLDIKLSADNRSYNQNTEWLIVKRNMASRRHVDYYVFVQPLNINNNRPKDLSDIQYLKVIGFTSGKMVRSKIGHYNNSKGEFIVNKKSLTNFSDLKNIINTKNEIKSQKTLIILPNKKYKYILNKDSYPSIIEEHMLNKYKTTNSGFYDNIINHNLNMLDGFSKYDWQKSKISPHNANHLSIKNPDLKIGQSKPQIFYRIEILEDYILSFTLYEDNSIDVHTLINQIKINSLKYNLTVDIKNLDLANIEKTLIKKTCENFKVKLID